MTTPEVSPRQQAELNRILDTARTSAQGAGGAPSAGITVTNTPRRRPSRPNLYLRSAPSGPKFEEGLSHTPLPTERKIYQYYCPLCMCHHKKILEASCCKHYMCHQCTHDMLCAKGMDAAIHFDPGNLPVQMDCPHCMQPNLALNVVAEGNQVRTYFDEEEGEASTSTAAKGPESPIKIGDSFDAIRRKMFTYEDERARAKEEEKAASKPVLMVERNASKPVLMTIASRGEEEDAGSLGGETDSDDGDDAGGNEAGEGPPGALREIESFLDSASAPSPQAAEAATVEVVDEEHTEVIEYDAAGPTPVDAVVIPEGPATESAPALEEATAAVAVAATG